jgi:hypothetical protein
MTAQLVYQTRITCDVCQMEVHQSATTPEGLNLEKYRARLVEAGWRYNGVTDICPRCVVQLDKVRTGKKGETK